MLFCLLLLVVLELLYLLLQFTLALILVLGVGGEGADRVLLAQELRPRFLDLFL